MNRRIASHGVPCLGYCCGEALDGKEGEGAVVFGPFVSTPVGGVGVLAMSVGGDGDWTEGAA
jgi:hypothetical protein